MLLALTLAAASLPGIEVRGGEGCVDVAAVREALARDGPPPIARARLRLELARAPGRIRARVHIVSPRGETTRILDIGPADCALLPTLTARIYRRYAESLPQLGPLEPVKAQQLRPRWFARERGFVSLTGSYDGPRLPRLGLHAGWARGPLGGLQWVGVVGLDSILDRRAGEGRFDLHRAWASAGLGGELSAGPWSAAGEVLIGGGAAFAVARGFDEGFDPVLPVAHLRLQARLHGPGGATGARPHLGVAGELGVVRVALDAPGGTFVEPLARVELAAGFTWGSVR